MESLNLVLTAAEVGLIPLPGDLVAVRDEDADGVDLHGRVVLRLLDEIGLGRSSEATKLVSGQYEVVVVHIGSGCRHLPADRFEGWQSRTPQCSWRRLWRARTCMVRQCRMAPVQQHCGTSQRASRRRTG